MEKIYSKVDGRLLHVVNRISNFKNRTDVIPEDNFLQCAILKMEKGKTFPPHKHITKNRHYPEQIAQESWVVIKGSVKCILYDLDDTIISEPVLEDDTLVYEYKTGPYEGQELDKMFIYEKD